jgi:O-antigen/teichoic acid export membrane protein
LVVQPLTFGFTLITTLISHDGVAAFGIGTWQLCFGGSAALYARLYIDYDIDKSRRSRHTRRRHRAAVLWWFSLSTLGFTLITTLINQDGLAALGVGIRQLCFGYSASLRSALHCSRH